MARLVSTTYGEALFALAKEQSKIDAFTEQIEMVQGVLAENPEFSKLMNHPKIDKDEKIQIVETVFEGRLDKELTGFFRLIVEKDRYNEVEEILSFFMEQVKEEKGIGVAFVKSAKELTDVQKKQIEQKLLETTSFRKMEMHFGVDEALIGGLVIRIGDKVVDSSIATKLSELTRQLMKIQLSM
jgi:F-type H+-transporting ATPase subunit delta